MPRKNALKPYIITTGAALVDRCARYDSHALTFVRVVGEYTDMLDHIGSLRPGDAIRLRTPYDWDGNEGWTAGFPDIEACLFADDDEAVQWARYVSQHTSGVYVVIRMETPTP